MNKLSERERNRQPAHIKARSQSSRKARRDNGSNPISLTNSVVCITMSEKTKIPPLATAQVILVELARLLGLENIRRNEGCCEIVVDGQWKVAVNPHDSPMVHNSVEIKPFHTFIWFNGWPAGMMTPFDGCFVQGTKASEDEFIIAMARRIERETNDGKVPKDVLEILEAAGIKL